MLRPTLIGVAMVLATVQFALQAQETGEAPMPAPVIVIPPVPTITVPAAFTDLRVQGTSVITVRFPAGSGPQVIPSWVGAPSTFRAFSCNSSGATQVACSTGLAWSGPPRGGVYTVEWRRVLGGPVVARTVATIGPR